MTETANFSEESTGPVRGAVLRLIWGRLIAKRGDYTKKYRSHALLSVEILRMRAVLLLLILGHAHGQEADNATESKTKGIIKGVTSSFSLPLKSWFQGKPSLREVFDKELAFGVTFNAPLFPASAPTAVGRLAEGDRGASNSNFSFSVKDNPITYWYFQTTFSAYIRPELQRSWNPDFTYSLGYDDWHPYTLSLTYSNYGGNRLQPRRRSKEATTRFEQGGVSLGWKFQLPEKLQRPFLLPGASTNWSAHYTVVPRYGDLATNRLLPWKQSASVTCTNNVYKFFYWTATALYYTHHLQQQPWDPDFTYGFGYFDYRPGKISIEYNNYAGNRYPWRHQGKSAGSFRSGGISVMWSVR